MNKWLNPDHIRLIAGELTAQEMRTVLAVVRAMLQEQSDREMEAIETSFQRTCQTCGGTREVDELVGEWPDTEHRTKPCPECVLRFIGAAGPLGDPEVLAEPQPSTPGESGFAPLPAEPYPTGLKVCRWPECDCHGPQGPGECRRTAGIGGTDA